MLSRNDSDDGEYRPPFPWRWVWIALALAVVGAVGYFLQQRAAGFRDIDVLQVEVKEIGSRYAGVDQEYAARMEDHQRNAPFSKFGPEQAIDPGTRSATRAWVAGAVGIIDAALAKREKIQNDTIARIEASRAPERSKAAMLKAVRDATIKSPMPVRLMNATRANLEKIAEIAEYLDQNAQGIALREGQLEFDDSAALDRYNDLQRERDKLQQELQALKEQASR